MKKFLIPLIIVLNIVTISAQDYKFGKVSKEELQEQFYPLDSSANAAVLYKNRNTYFNYIQDKGFQVITEVQERIKIYNSEGFDWATKKIELYNSNSAKEKVSGLKATTFVLVDDKIDEIDLSRKDVFIEEVNNYWSEEKFTMPNLTAGCIVEWKYSIISPFMSINDVEFQYSIPIKKMEVSIETPEYYVYKKRPKGYIFLTPKVEQKKRSITLVEKKLEGFYIPKTKYTPYKVNYFSTKESYDINNIPALIEEPYVNNIENYLAAIKYEYSELNWPNEPVEYFASSWEDVTKTIYNDSDFSNQIYKSNHYEDDLAAVLSGLNTDGEKITAIFELVKQKIKWNNYNGFTTLNGTRKAYKEGVGNAADINLNLVSMLTKAGYNANPVIISTRAHGIPLYATINGFNFVIAAIELNGETILLDATDPNSTPNNLPERDLNWQGRLIREDLTSSSIDLAPNEPAVTTFNTVVKINDEGSIEGMQRKTYTNLLALNYRDDYMNVKDEDIILKFENKNNLEVQDFKILNKDNIYKTAIENVKFTSDNLIDRVGPKMYLKPLLFNSLTENPFKLNKREYPIDFSTKTATKCISSITIPEGYVVESIPESFAIGLPNEYGKYLFKIENQGNRINTVAQLEINTAIYPAQFYEELKDFYQQIVKKNTEQVVLRKI